MKINKHAILTFLSIAGTISAVAVTAYMAPKAKERIEKKKIELVDNDIKHSDISESEFNALLKKKTFSNMETADRIEVVKAAAPYCIPSTLLCTFTIFMIILNQKEYKKEFAAMSATTAYLVANRNKLKRLTEKPVVKKVIDKVLPSKEEFKHQTIETTGNGDLLCIEGYSGRIFRSTQDAVIDAEEKLNEEYLSPECGYCCLNDFYRFLGIEESQFGWQYGWVNARDHGKPTEEYYPNEPIEFSNELVAADAPGNNFGEPIYCIDLNEYWYPIECWMEV